MPEVVVADDGRWSVEGLVVQRKLIGREPTTRADWTVVGATLRQIHGLTTKYPQRPGCCIVTQLGERRVSGDADLDAVPPDVADVCIGVLGAATSAPVSVVHGDPGPTNILLSADRTVGLIDWDESRVDISEVDLAELPVPALPARARRAASLRAIAWETLNAWSLERQYAERRFRELRAALESSPSE